MPTPTIETAVIDFPLLSTSLQDFRAILSDGSTGNPEGINRITSMYYQDGQLLVNTEQWYNATGQNKDTTLVVRDINNLASAIEGFYEIDGKAR